MCSGEGRPDLRDESRREAVPMRDWFYVLRRDTAGCLFSAVRR